MEVPVVYSMCEMLGPGSPKAACTSIWAFLPKRALGTTEVQELQRISVINRGSIGFLGRNAHIDARTATAARTTSAW